MAPKDENELRQMLLTALYCGHPAALRYPRGNGVGVPLESPITALPVGQAELLREGTDLLLVALGSMVAPAEKVAQQLAEEGVSCAVINARFVKPLDQELIGTWAKQVRAVVALEEGCAPGGFSSAICEFLADEGIPKPILRCAIPDHIVSHGDPKLLMEEEGLGPDSLLRRIRDFQRHL